MSGHDSEILSKLDRLLALTEGQAEGQHGMRRDLADMKGMLSAMTMMLTSMDRGLAKLDGLSKE